MLENIGVFSFAVFPKTATLVAFLPIVFPAQNQRSRSGNRIGALNQKQHQNRRRIPIAANRRRGPIFADCVVLGVGLAACGARFAEISTAADNIESRDPIVADVEAGCREPPLPRAGPDLAPYQSATSSAGSLRRVSVCRRSSYYPPDTYHYYLEIRQNKKENRHRIAEFDEDGAKTAPKSVMLLRRIRCSCLPGWYALHQQTRDDRRLSRPPIDFDQTRAFQRTKPSQLCGWANTLRGHDAVR
jgi:hypothetical protein